MVNQWLERLVLEKLPGWCVLCEGKGQKGLDICLRCQRRLIPVGNVCVQCARPVPSRSQSHCGKCLVSAPVFKYTVTPFKYQSPLSDLIHGFKYRDNHCFGKILTQLLSTHINEFYGEHFQADAWPEAIIATPLHSHRLLRRGFNQALVLAKTLGRTMHLPVIQPIKRIRNTPPQQSLSAYQRKANLNGAFRVKQPIHYQTVAIVDDVITTGSTINSLARMVQIAGVREIHVWAIAKTTYE